MARYFTRIVARSVGRLAGLILLSLGSTGCGGLLGPSESGLSTPKDPGKVIVQVRDLAGVAVRNAYVTVEMPNSIGSFFKEGSWTKANGTVTFHAVPAGRRPVEVKPPAGYSAGPAPLVRETDVVKGGSVTLEFRLARD